MPIDNSVSVWYNVSTVKKTDRLQAGKETKMKYNVTRIFADGTERKCTLAELAREIEHDNPNEFVEVISKKKGIVWSGHAKNITTDLTQSYCKLCVQELSIDEYGVTLVMR